MNINDDTIINISELARLELSDFEKEGFKKDMNSIMSHFDKLAEINTDSVLPISQITGLSNVFRSDNVSSFILNEELVKQAPASSDNGSILVKNVL